MQEYQLALLLSPALNETDKEKLEEKIEGFVKEVGEASNKESGNKIRLAYPVKKETEAFLACYYFKTEKIAALQSKLEEEKDILRWLLIKEDKKKETKIKKKKTEEKPKEETEEESKKEEEKPKKAKKEKEGTNIDEELEKVLNE